MEIVVKKLENGVIEFNYTDLKKYLTESLEKYEGLTYDEETIGSAKKDRATLNKLKKALDDKRKDIKSECLKPYTEFELKVNELKGLVDSPMIKIDEQVKGYEEFLRSEKMKEVLWVYEDNIGDLKEILPYAKIQNDKWLNATYKMATVIEDITSIIRNVRAGLEIIDNLDTEFKFELKHKYLENLDITQAMREKETLERNKKNLEELAKKEEETGEIIELEEEPKEESFIEKLGGELLEAHFFAGGEEAPKNLQILETFWSSNKGTCGLIIARDTKTQEIKTFFGHGKGEDSKKDINFICNWGQKLEEDLMKSLFEQYFKND